MMKQARNASSVFSETKNPNTVEHRSKRCPPEEFSAVEGTMG